jgi:hypothetical protein
MINLRTVRRVLALDLGLDAEAVQRCLNSAAPIRAEAADSTEISLEEALHIVEIAEALTLPVAS